LLGSTGLGFGQPADGTMGRVEGGEVLSLGTSATGTIAEMPVSAGDRVKAGQRLVQVECSAVEREVEARKSDLAAAEAANLRVQHGPRPEEISVGVANVNLADARLHEAQRAYDRVQQLREGITVTRVQIDQAERDAHMAAALLEEMRAKLHLLQAGSREEDIAEARARRDAAKARVDEAAARLSYCAVVAPIDGTIVSVHVSPGQLVSTMAPVILLTMVDDSKRHVRAFVDEREISKVCQGEHARIAADGVPGMQFDGVVESVGAVVVDNPLVHNASRQFRQVMLAVAENQQPTIGLRVSVQFSPCTAGQRGPR
jgi:HlyD family secretion protein